MEKIKAQKGEALTHIFQRLSERTGLDVEAIRKAVYGDHEEATNDERI